MQEDYQDIRGTPRKEHMGQTKEVDKMICEKCKEEVWTAYIKNPNGYLSYPEPQWVKVYKDRDSRCEYWCYDCAEVDFRNLPMKGKTCVLYIDHTMEERL